MEENAAAEKLGVETWDRPAIFRETAEAATETNLPYWLVLLLSGAIAMLGLALNSAAVVIGAMLIAPLLAPIVGLALALAVGDGRLTVKMLVVVLLSTLGVVLVAAALTALLPYQTITPEIESRTRPTTLDLGIAVFSGLAGAVVTVARRSRLSAAVPGVAISVALVPPLAVAGYGVGVGLDFSVIRGAMLLYGANLGGIVLSGTALFLLVGMHRPDVLDAARAWHAGESKQGFSGWLDVAPGVRSLGVLRSPWTRLGLVIGFVLLVAFPLSASLKEIAREARVERAAAEAATVFEQPGRSSILNRRVNLDAQPVRVLMRVATTAWYGDAERHRFEQQASTMAGEPVELVLEQLPAAGEDVERLAEMVRGRASEAVPDVTPAARADMSSLLGFVRSRADEAVERLLLPDSARLGGYVLAFDTTDTLHLTLDYTAPFSLSDDATAILARQLQRDLSDVPLRVEVRRREIP